MVALPFAPGVVMFGLLKILMVKMEIQNLNYSPADFTKRLVYCGMKVHYTLRNAESLPNSWIKMEMIKRMCMKQFMPGQSLATITNILLVPSLPRMAVSLFQETWPSVMKNGGAVKA